MRRKILQLAVPNIISNITVPLLGMVDLAVVGHLKDIYYVGAVALGTAIFNFLYWGFAFLRMSTSGLAAQAYGAGEEEKTGVILQRTALISMAAGVLMLLLQYPIAKISFTLFQGTPEVEKYARSYFYIRIWAAPATLLLYSLNGWFLGMQNARYTMYITLVINILNIGLDFLFVFVLGMHADGVALGTLLANYIGLLVAILLLRKKYPYALRFHPMRSLLDPVALRKLFGINADIFIRTACIIAVHTFFTARSARLGDSLLAVNTLLLQFFMIFSYLIDGFAFAAEALTGRYVGAKQPAELRRSISALFLFGLLISLPFSLIYFLAGKDILSVLTNNAAVLSLAGVYLFWTGIIPLISFPAFLWDGIYIGATASRGMRNTMLVSTIVFFFPVYFLTRDILHNHALWLSLTLYLFIRGVSMTIMAKKNIFAPT